MGRIQPWKVRLEVHFQNDMHTPVMGFMVYTCFLMLLHQSLLEKLLSPFLSQVYASTPVKKKLIQCNILILLLPINCMWFDLDLSCCCCLSVSKATFHINAKHFFISPGSFFIHSFTSEFIPPYFTSIYRHTTPKTSRIFPRIQKSIFVSSYREWMYLLCSTKIGITGSSFLSDFLNFYFVKVILKRALQANRRGFILIPCHRWNENEFLLLMNRGSAIIQGLFLCI